MPTYEYKCKSCGVHFERFQSMTDEPVRVCDECGGEVERLISTGAGFLFKGSGFYITDYRSREYKRAAAADKPTVESKETKKESPKTKTTVGT